MSKPGKLRSKGLKQFFGAATPLTGGGGWREKEIWLKTASFPSLGLYFFRKSTGFTGFRTGKPFFVLENSEKK